jgi:hypothetical protein
MPAIERVLANLERVKRCGKGYVARCPAHEDRSASLSVCEADSGNALVHCFAGCSTRDIVAALGLRMGDLFARPLGEPEKRQRANKAVLRQVCTEGLVIVCAASHGATMNEVDRDRLRTAHARLRAALTLQDLQGASEVRRIADYAGQLLRGTALDEIETDRLTECVEWLSWLIAGQEKPGGKARLQGDSSYA